MDLSKKYMSLKELLAQKQNLTLELQIIELQIKQARLFLAPQEPTTAPTTTK